MERANWWVLFPLILFGSAFATEAQTPYVDALASCVAQSDNKDCKAQIYSMKIDVDYVTVSKDGIEGSFRPMTRSYFAWRSKEAMPKGSVAHCQTVEDQRNIACVSTVQGIDFLPPLSRDIQGRVSVKYVQSWSSADFHRDWVPLAWISQSEWQDVEATVKSAFDARDICTEDPAIERISPKRIFGLQCVRYDLLNPADGVGLVSRCRHRVTNGTVGPPISDSCSSEIAVVDGKVWVMAVTRVTRECPNCSAARVDFSVDLDQNRNGPPVSEGFEAALFSNLKELLRAGPWHISNLAYDDKYHQFSAVTGKRRSKIIDGFEDLSLFIYPVIDSKSQFRQIGNSIDRPGVLDRGEDVVSLSAIVEVFKSIYDTSDDSYWTPPSKEQTHLYEGSLRDLIKLASQNACNSMGLVWNEAPAYGSVCSTHSK